MKLIVEPADGVGPLLSAINHAKRSVEAAIFRFDRRDIEAALMAAAARGVRVTALIAFHNRGGEKSLRELELRFLDAGIIVARTSGDLVRYHGKYIIIDRHTLYVLSFNFTRLDIDRSRGFGIITTAPNVVREATNLFKADCTRTRYVPKVDTFVVSPANSRRVCGTFLKRAKTQLLIYDPSIADREMLRILHDRAKAGVEIRVIGKLAGRAFFDVQKLAGMRLHTRTIIRDRRQAFIGSQSLRTLELDARREVGLIIQDPKAIKKLIDTFESDWTEVAARKTKGKADPIANDDATKKSTGASARQVSRAIAVFTQELQPLTTAVKRAVRQAVVKAGDDVLHDKSVKNTMKQVVKDAVKEAVKEAVHDAQGAEAAHDAKTGEPSRRVH